MKWFKQFVMWLTPMTYDGFAFTDIVTGESVFYYRDAYGVKWMKNSKFGLFKAKVNT